MKHQLLFQRFFASLLLLTVSTLSWAKVVEINGIVYNVIIKAQQAEVTYHQDRAYAGSVVIPETITCEGKECTVTSIGQYAFYYCSGLTSIEIPESVTSINKDAFIGCTGLPVTDNIRYADTYLMEVVDKTQSTYNIKDGTRFIGGGAFKGCSGLTSITIPNSVTSIGIYTFENCSSLTSVTIPTSVTIIGDYAFSGCSSLTSVDIPNSVTSIGNDAFWGCSGLTFITIPNSVTSIGDYAFSGCTGLTSLTIGNSVTSIGESAFSICPSLTFIVVDASNPNYDSRNNCNAIVDKNSNTLITGCKNTIIPNSVTSIGNYAFKNCSDLMSITIPESVTSIGKEVFLGCTGLTSVTIPNSVTSIGKQAFLGCQGLTSVTIPNSVASSIGDYAFNNCSGLTSITIGSGVISIGQGAFSYCPELTDLYCFAENVPYTGRDVFKSSYVEHATLHVPSSSIELYKTATPWCNFSAILPYAPAGINEVKENANSQQQADGKYIKNGRIYVVKNGLKYNIDGNRNCVDD